MFRKPDSGLKKIGCAGDTWRVPARLEDRPTETATPVHPWIAYIYSLTHRTTGWHMS